MSNRNNGYFRKVVFLLYAVKFCSRSPLRRVEKLESNSLANICTFEEVFWHVLETHFDKITVQVFFYYLNFFRYVPRGLRRTRRLKI